MAKAAASNDVRSTIRYLRANPALHARDVKILIDTELSLWFTLSK